MGKALSCVMAVVSALVAIALLVIVVMEITRGLYGQVAWSLIYAGVFVLLTFAFKDQMTQFRELEERERRLAK